MGATFSKLISHILVRAVLLHTSFLIILNFSHLNCLRLNSSSPPSYGCLFQFVPSPPAVPWFLRKTFRPAMCCCHGSRAVTACPLYAITPCSWGSCLTTTGQCTLPLLTTRLHPTSCPGRICLSDTNLWLVRSEFLIFFFNLYFFFGIWNGLNYSSVIFSVALMDFSLLLSLRLKPFTSYQFRIKATNDIGDSEYSEESEAITTLQDGKILEYCLSQCCTYFPFLTVSLRLFVGRCIFFEFV